MQNKPLVSIGLLSYNRPKFLKEALSSIVNQTYQNLEIIISDNCSPNQEVIKIIESFQKTDKRIKLYQQKKNIGAVANFKFALKQATSKYFMWASDDDLWKQDFIQMGLRVLLKKTEYKAWFCTVENIDSYNRVIRQYDGFSRFTSNKYKFMDIIKYLFEPEILGKANIIYSIYDKKALQSIIVQYFLTEHWGSDVCFNLAFLSRYNMFFSDKVLLQKRIVRDSDDKNMMHPVIIKYLSLGVFPLKESVRYLIENTKAVKSLKYKMLTALVIFIRMPISAVGEIFLKYRKILHKIKHNEK